MDTEHILRLLNIVEKPLTLVGIFVPVQMITAAALANPVKVRETAQGWRESANQLATAKGDLQGAVKGIQGWEGEAYEAFERYIHEMDLEMQRVHGNMQDIAQTLDEIAKVLENLQKLLLTHLQGIAELVTSILDILSLKKQKGAIQAGLQQIIQSISDALKKIFALYPVLQGLCAIDDFNVSNLRGTPSVGNRAGVPFGDWGPRNNEETRAAREDAGAQGGYTGSGSSGEGSGTSSGASAGSGNGADNSGSGSRSGSRSGSGAGGHLGPVGFDFEPPGGFPSGGYQTGQSGS